MKRILTVFLLLVLSFSIVCFKSNAYDNNSNTNLNRVLNLKLRSSASKNQNRIFYGTWIIKKVIAYGRVTAYGNKEIKKMIGIKIIYNQDKAVYNNKVLKKPYYCISSLNKNEFFTSAGYVNLSDLGIKKNHITMVEVEINKKSRWTWETAGSYFFIKNKNCLILNAGVSFLI